MTLASGTRYLYFHQIAGFLDEQAGKIGVAACRRGGTLRFDRLAFDGGLRIVIAVRVDDAQRRPSGVVSPDIAEQLRRDAVHAHLISFTPTKNR